MLKDEILETIIKYNMIESGEGIVVGVSGGPDSMCLLNNLIQINKDEKIDLNFKLYVAHINHMIRKEAKEETVYVEQFCAKNNIGCFVKMEDVKKASQYLKIGTEEAGRKIRYEFFKEVMQKTNSSKIAIAHNLNDKVETILMNIIRGTSPSGLKGIEPIRGNLYIRPLIEIKRTQIEEYCNKEKLNPKIDKTNFENIYTRNKIRNMLIPFIKEQFNPNIIEGIDKLSKITEQEQNYLDKIVNNIYDDLLIDDTQNNIIKFTTNAVTEASLGHSQNREYENQIILDLKKFNNQDIVIKRKIILYTIKKVYGNAQNIEKIHIDDIIKLCERNIGNKYLTPHKNIKIYIKNKKIFFIAYPKLP